MSDVGLKRENSGDVKTGTADQRPVNTTSSNENDAGTALTDPFQGEQILEQATVRSSESVMKFITLWTSIRKEDNERFHTIRTRCLSIASRYRSGDLTADQCLLELKHLVQEILDTMDQLRLNGEVDLSSWAPASWLKDHPLLSDTTPVTATFNLPADFWNTKPNDSRPVKKKKLLQQIQNKTRALIPGSPKHALPETRTFSIGDFVRFHLEVPFGLLLLGEWQMFLRTRSVDRHWFTEDTLEVFSDLVLLIGDGPNQPLTDEESQKLDEYIRSHSQTSDDIPEATGDDRRQQCTDLIASVIESNKTSWAHAGTPLLPGSDFDAEEVEREWSQLEKRYESIGQAWRDHTLGSQDDLRHDLVLLLAQIDAIILCRDTIDLFNKKIRENYTGPLKEVVGMISAAAESIQDNPGGSTDDLRKRILAQNRTLVRTLRNERIPAIQKEMDAAQLPKVAGNFLSRIEHAMDGLPEQCRVFQKNEYDSLLPDSTFIEIPLRSFVSTEAVPPLTRDHELFLEDLNGEVGKVRRDVGELDQAITFHLESALELLETGETEGSGHEAAAGGLARTKQLAERILNSEEAIALKAVVALSEMTARFARKVHSFTDNEQVIALKAKIIQSRVKEEVGGYKETVLGSSKKGLSVTLSFLRIYTEWFRDRLSRFRKAAGLNGPSKEEEEDLALWLNTARIRINGLPFPYRRLFRVEPLQDKTFFGGRHEDLQTVEDDFRSWMETRMGALALVGEKGSGKTTIVQCAMAGAYSKLPVKRIDLAGQSVHTEATLLSILLDVLDGTDGESFDALEKRLTSLSQPLVIVVEDIQNLFLRKVGGFHALERLLLLISTTSHSVYWVITCTRYTWHYFEKVLTIPRFFRREIHLGGIDHDEVENILMWRHRISGYGLKFQPTPAVEQSKRYQQMETEEEKQTYLMDDCLERINELASGNITLAMLCWLTACTEITDDTVIVSFTPPDSNALNQFPAQDLFSLAVVLLHETVSAAEHAVIFHQDIQQSLLLLRRLVAKGLLIENNNLFRINTLLYRAAVRTLTQKNILH